jgi:hypothetical protein
MDLAAPHDDVLTQKDQANTAFLLPGSGLELGLSPLLSKPGFK